MDLGELTLATFEPLVAETFAVVVQPATIELVLESATTLGARPGGRDPFTLVFRGPPEPLLPQATYTFEHADLGVLEIFIVPIGRDADGTIYEAIFT
ncbi:MAG: hypothetical protein QOG94_303 [Solirubrobacteraceae bacterium]|jgi:hypothetical protein|nr:hypothetical protein [Solirubrobacteraceae bacterium]